MTAAKLRELADREDAAALRALDAGDAELAREYRLLATLHREVAAAMERQGLERLTPAEHSATLPPMTSAEAARRKSRGLAISVGKADDWFSQAFTAKGWSQRRYAKQVLKVSPSTLSEWRKGLYPVPRSVAEHCRVDLGIPDSKRSWPAGIDENR